MEKAVQTPGAPRAYPEFIVYRPFTEFTGTGTLGNGMAGTAEKGKEAFTRMTDRLVAFVESEEFQL